ncbi:hypothetical protein ABIE45_004400 [Methylobacterium sp. OAE515]|uniref:hypothetical protein n=1 Tax=Methylobacterium sp. OAE515 TaxID=2817895 RepID=UPI0017891780
MADILPLAALTSESAPSGGSRPAGLRPGLQPCIVEVVVLQPLGSAEAAIQAARAEVARLLADVALTGVPTTPTPATDAESRQIANAAMVQAVARAVLERALEAVPAIARAQAKAAIAELLTTPHVLTGLIAAAKPDTPETPYLSGGLLAVTPPAATGP